MIKKTLLGILMVTMLVSTMYGATATTTFTSGTVFGNDGVNYTNANILTADTFTIGDDYIKLNEENISLRPASGSLNITINTWTNSYDDTIYDTSFTAKTTATSWTYKKEYSLDIRFINEETKNLIDDRTITANFISDELSFNRTTTNGIINLTSLTNQEYIIQYTANEYNPRSYILTVDDDTNAIINLSLLNTTQATNVSIIVYNELGDRVEGAKVKVLKYYVSTNSFELVEIAKTNFQGETSASLELENSYYKFIIEYLGVTVYSSGSTLIYADNLNFYIDTSTYNPELMFDLFKLTGSIDYDNSTQRVSFTWNDEQNTATQGCIKSYKWVYGVRSYFNTTCASTAAGTIYLSAPNGSITYDFTGIVTKNGIEYTVAELTKSFKVDLPDKTNGLFYMILIMLVFSGIFIWSEVIGTVIVGTVPMIFSIIGFIPFGLSITVPIFMISLIIAYFLGRSG